MLVLSRKTDEKIVIGEGENQVVITVVAIGDGKVRLGIDADRKVPVHRLEVYEAIKREQENGGAQGGDNNGGTSSGSAA